MAQRGRHSNTKIIWIVAGVLGGVFLVVACVCGGMVYWLFSRPAVFNSKRPGRGLEPQKDDYAEVRGRFKTRLMWRGPSPQEWQPTKLRPDAQEVIFPSGDLRLKAWVNPPPDGEQAKKPAVLFLHGGFAFDVTDWDQAAPFRHAGFVVLTPWLRGENGQPGSFSLFYDEVDDVLAAAEYLAEQPYVDADRLYVAGHHAGGTLTLLAAMASPRFRAAASFSGSPDQLLFAQSQPGFVPFNANNLLEYQMRSPVAYAASFKCPVRLYLGNQESLLRGPSRRTAELAREKGLDVQVVGVAGDHMSSVEPAMRQAIAFFEQKGAR
jgi:dienelactone hydrolase